MRHLPNGSAADGTTRADEALPGRREALGSGMLRLSASGRGERAGCDGAAARWRAQARVRWITVQGVVEGASERVPTTVITYRIKGWSPPPRPGDPTHPGASGPEYRCGRCARRPAARALNGGLRTCMLRPEFRRHPHLLRFDRTGVPATAPHKSWGFIAESAPQAWLRVGSVHLRTAVPVKMGAACKQPLPVLALFMLIPSHSVPFVPGEARLPLDPYSTLMHL